MSEWTGLTNLSIDDALVLGGILPYLMMATGRLVPRKNVEDWREAYFKSEAAREVLADANQKVLAYLESADQILRGITAQPSPRPEAPHVPQDR